MLSLMCGVSVLHRSPTPFQVGRDKAVEAPLYHMQVSRRHARFAPDPGREGWTVEDLGSKNGVWVNMNRIPPNTPFPIQSGDEVLIGNVPLGVVIT